MTIGFNIGQMQHFLAMSQKGNADLSSAQTKKIIENTPKDWLDNLRFSGTMSNTMNLSKICYGEDENALMLALQLHKKLYPGLLDQLKLAVWALTGNDTAVLNNVKKKVPNSYLYNMRTAYQQLKSKNFYFTFNSHMPYLKRCTLDESLTSLKFVADNFNLKTVELENETYMSDYLTSGLKGNYEKNIDNYFLYLEKEVIPKILLLAGNIPLGISYCKPSNKMWKYWRLKAVDFATRMKRLEIDIFLVPHVYLDSTSDIEIIDTLSQELKDTAGHDVMITEFGTNSSAGKMSQDEEIDFIQRFAHYAQIRGVKGVFKHTLFVPQSNHFSFIK